MARSCKTMNPAGAGLPANILDKFPGVLSTLVMDTTD